MMLTEAILGIDIGSTSTRIFLWCPSNDAQYHIENKKRNNLKCTRYERGDFSSTGYPFDGGEVYIGDDPNPERRSTSLKFGFYVLAEASDELVEQYSLVEPLMERREDLAFRDRLRQGLEGLLKVLYGRVTQVCKAKRLSISTIGLSVPAQWNLDFEEVYKDLVASVFNHPPSEIYFHTETEALAHHLFKNHLDELQDNGANGHLLFLDFGGHNMNGCIFKLVYGKDGVVNFYRAGESFGAGGGSEQWEYNVGLIGDRYLKHLLHRGVPSKTRQALLDDFNSEKTTLGPENSRTVTFSFEANGILSKVMLDAHSIDICFEEALRAPLQVAADHIAQLGKYKCRSRKVIVSGGTSRNRTLQSRLRKLCADASLPEPLFTDDLEIAYETAKIAKGVAYAAGNRRTVEDFFQSGAAFGVQVKQIDTPSNNNADGLWDDTALFLLDMKRQKLQSFPVQSGDELKIVCDPFWSAAQDMDEDDELRAEQCYDILSLGHPKRTRNYQIKLSLSGSGDSMFLTVETSRRWGKPSATKNKDKKTYPLQFDRGTNCVYVGVRGHSLEELSLSNESGVLEINDANTSLAETDSLQEEDDLFGDGDEAMDVTEDGISPQPMERQELQLITAADDSVYDVPMTPPVSPSTAGPRVKPQGSLRNEQHWVEPFRKRNRVSKT